jgi:hypothetical protein
VRVVHFVVAAVAALSLAVVNTSGGGGRGCFGEDGGMHGRDEYRSTCEEWGMKEKEGSFYRENGALSSPCFYGGVQERFVVPLQPLI